MFRTSYLTRRAPAVVFLLAIVFASTTCRRNSPEMPSETGSSGKDSGEPESTSTDQPYRSSLLDANTIPPRSRLTRTTILNTLADRFDYQSYLEVGQGRKQDNFDWVTCRKKVGVDPNRKVQAAFALTSDEFFAQNHDFFDLIFIDGLHLAGQVERDILNSLAVLNSRGRIVVHDCNPTTEDMQRVPWQGQHAWTGDVWKAWVKLRAARRDLEMSVVDVDSGCGIISRGTQDTIEPPAAWTYELFEQNRTKWLNLIDVKEFLRELKSSK
jgi:hypothetical protein